MSFAKRALIASAIFFASACIVIASGPTGFPNCSIDDNGPNCPNAGNVSKCTYCCWNTGCSDADAQACASCCVHGC